MTASHPALALIARDKPAWLTKYPKLIAQKIRLWNARQTPEFKARVAFLKARAKDRAGYCKDPDGFRARFIKTASAGLAAGGNARTQTSASPPSQLQIQTAAATLSPQVARPPVATPVVAARPAVAAKPVVTAPTAREYNEVLRLWTDKQVGKYMGGSKLKAAMDGFASYIQTNGRTAAYVMMKQDLASK